MADFTLSDGTEINFDLNKINRYEIRNLLSDEQSDEDANKTLAKTCELDAQQIHDLGYVDWRGFIKAFWDKATNPLSDPNE